MTEEEAEWPPEWMPFALRALTFRSRRSQVGTVLPSSACHYCGAKATSEDHIVPRVLLPKPLSRLPYWFRSNDVVPACGACNWTKGPDRSDCECDHCRWAWGAAIGCGWVTREQYAAMTVVLIVRSP